jgi:hypothetical protein
MKHIKLFEAFESYPLRSHEGPQYKAQVYPIESPKVKKSLERLSDYLEMKDLHGLKIQRYISPGLPNIVSHHSRFYGEWPINVKCESDRTNPFCTIHFDTNSKTVQDKYPHLLFSIGTYLRSFDDGMISTSGIEGPDFTNIAIQYAMRDDKTFKELVEYLIKDIQEEEMIPLKKYLEETKDKR